MELDRIELVQLEDGRIALWRYHLGMLHDSAYVAEDDLAAWLQPWQELPVVLARTTAHLAEPLRAAGFAVRLETPQPARVAELNRVELLRLENEQVAVRRYEMGLLREATIVAETDLIDLLKAWDSLSVVLYRSAAPLAEALRAAGFVVRAK